MATLFLGIQICNTSVFAAMVRRESKQASLLGTYRIGIDNLADDTPPLVQLCEHIAADHDLTQVQCAVSIPASQAYYRTLEVPFKDDKKIRQILPYELEPILPEPVDQLSFDYGHISADGTGKLLAVAVETVTLASIKEALDVHKLKPAVLTIDGFPLIQALLKHLEAPRDFLFLSGSEDACLMAAISAANISAVRIISGDKGGFGDIKAFCRNICLTHIGFNEQGQELYDPVCLLAALPDKNFAILKKRLSTELPFPIRKIGPFIGQTSVVSNIPESTQKSHWAQGPLTVAISGMERQKPFINFSRQESPLRHFWDEYKRKLVTPLVLLVVLLGLALAGVIYQTTTLQNSIDRLDSQISTILQEAFPEVTTIVDPVQQMQVELRELELSTTAGFMASGQPLMIDLLKSISEAVAPETDVVFTRLVIGKGDIIISGTTDTYNTVDEIKSRLQATTTIKTVTTTSADKEKRGNRIRFRFKVGLVTQ